MRILHIITSLSDGGAEAVLYRLVTNDLEHVHEVVSLRDEGKYGSLLRIRQVRVHCLGLPRARVTPVALVHLWRIVRTYRPDVVQTWMYHADLIGGLVARAAGVRAIVWGIHHSMLEPATSSRHTIVVARVLALLSRRVPRRIVVCAEHAAAVHGAIGYDLNRMRVVPNGCDLALFAPDPIARKRLRHEWGVGDDDVLIGMVGRLDPNKDHSNLLHALSLLRNRAFPVRCVLVGRGMDNTSADAVRMLREFELQARVLLLGMRSDVSAIMASLDFHVLSSSSEAFPNVMVEAMACGTPCVTTNVGDAAAIVGRTGWVVPPRNPTALAIAIDAAIDAVRLADWGNRRQAARSRVALHYTIAQMVASYSHTWEEALSSSLSD